MFNQQSNFTTDKKEYLAIFYPSGSQDHYLNQYSSERI